MPAEWEPHAATWLTWPHNRETWPDPEMEEVESAFLDIISALISGEDVHVLVPDPAAGSRIRARLPRRALGRSRVHFHPIPTNDSWIRDYGPNFLIRRGAEGNEIAMNKWSFNSWGGKYPWKLDDRAGRRIAESLGWPVFEPGWVLEGGAVEVNGRGTCLTTETCLLHPNRNPGQDRFTMERVLQDYLGVSRVIWLQGEIPGDDTDGHIDNLARFVNPTTVLCADEETASDPHHPGLRENHRRLAAATDQDHRPLTVVPLPMPDPVGAGSTRFPASYANFYIGNRVVLVPAFGQMKDDAAQSLLQKYFPDRQVVPIPHLALIRGLGGVHCLTQQQPL